MDKAWSTDWLIFVHSLDKLLEFCYTLTEIVESVRRIHAAQGAAQQGTC